VYKYNYFIVATCLVLLDHLQANIQRYEVPSVHIMYCGISYYLQGVHKNSLKLKNYIYTSCIHTICN